VLDDAGATGEVLDDVSYLLVVQVDVAAAEDVVEADAVDELV
jgi:hypothetical protein